jgi:hypothetical protein
MPQPIKVDNDHPVTPYETARTLGVSKRRTDQIVREVRRILLRDPKTGEFVIRARKTGKNVVNSSRNGTTKFKKTRSSQAHPSQKTSAARRKA